MSLKKIISILLILFIFLYLLWTIAVNWEGLQSYPWNVGIHEVLFIIFLSTLVPFINAFGWHLVTKSLNLNYGVIENIYIWMISNLSRFLPGGIWQYPTRLYFYSKKGFSKNIVISALLIEGSLSLVVGAIISSSSFFLNKDLQKEYFFLFFMFIFLVSALLCFYILFLSNNLVKNKIINFIKPLFKKIELLNDVHINIGQFILTIIFYMFTFIVPGLILFFITKTAINVPIIDAHTFISMFALAWIIGYLSIFAPGGIGVMDVILATLLSNFVPIYIASLIAILFRISLLVGEALSLAIIISGRGRKLYFLGNHKKI